jgi:hypothetical protein
MSAVGLPLVGVTMNSQAQRRVGDDHLARQVAALDATAKVHVGLALTTPNAEKVREHGSDLGWPASMA